MSADAVALEDRLALTPGLPAPADLADVWLAYAFCRLLEACELTDTTLRELVDPASRPIEFLVRPHVGSGGETARHRRLDAGRFAVLDAGLAVEARLNRVLRLRDPDDWSTVAHLVPVEKLRLAPRLLRDVESVPDHGRLCELAAVLFESRGRLVHAGGPTSMPEQEEEQDAWFDPSHARAAVAAGAEICTFLAALARRDDEATGARLIATACERLERRAEACSAAGQEPQEPAQWSWTLDAEFPPDLVGS
ncbi:MAG: hypothetical protein ACXVRJ_02765 [Gaiellaceae bacterium]